MKKFTIFILIAFILFIHACNTYTPASKVNISSSYKPSERNYHPDISFYNNSKDSITIFLKQHRAELKYDDYLSSRLKIKLEILSGYNSDEIIDSIPIMIYDTLDGSKGNYLKLRKSFQLASGSDYIIKTTLHDINEKKKNNFYHSISKENAYERDFFEILDKNGNHRYSDIINSTDSFKIRYEHTPYVYVRYFGQEFESPRPPYLNAKEENPYLKTDSIFRIPLEDGLTKTLNFSKNGIYHIQADTSQKAGYTVFHFQDNYPSISSPDEMLPPLRYIATSREYKKLKESKNIKEAIDDFWLNISGNPDRARVMIRNYYTRVEKANRLFYTHKAGWKTERGMVYIVMGAPTIVYRSNNAESWIYGESAKYNALKLDFTKVKNPFTENDYSLNRSPIYKDEWFFAIDIWRR
mgnify:CR=1 FL=1